MCALDTRELIDTIVMHTFSVKYNVQKLRLGEPVRLRRDPENRIHKNTIRVENEGGALLGYIIRELADFTAPYMDLSKCDLEGKVAELALDAQGESIRLQICFYLPSYWFRVTPYPEHLYIQDIDYYYWEDDITGSIKVFINCSERMFNKIKNNLYENNLRFEKYSGLSHRYPIGKPPYQWCIHFSKTNEITESKIKTFFEKTFNITSARKHIQELNKEKNQLEFEKSFLQDKIKDSEEQIQRLDSEAKKEKEDLNSSIFQLEKALDDKEKALSRNEKDYQTLQYKYDVKQSWNPIISTSNQDDVIKTEILFKIFQQGISDKLTPEEALNVISAIFPERIIVLDNAIESAKKSERFKHKKKLFEELLWRLATEHWKLLVRGKGDVEIKQQYPSNCYSAKEAETVEKSPRLRKLRQFYYNNSDVEMMSHLKTGVEDNVEHTIRIHFKWYADERKIVIGYCGPHLPLK